MKSASESIYETVISLRNIIIRGVYKNILKKIFFQIDPEQVHAYVIKRGTFLGSDTTTKYLVSFIFDYKNKKLEQTIAGLHFPNPIGLAAGFDKNAELTQMLPEIGFGHMEVGSITGEPCAGNPQPRLWRLPKSQSLVVYYGLKNEGCEAIAKRLGKGEALPKPCKRCIPLGISIAKTNCKATCDETAGIQDYAKVYTTLKPFADYITINISCPNSFGGLQFTNPKCLEQLLKKIRSLRDAKPNVPIFLKLGADLTSTEVDDIIKVARIYHITGFICTNLTKIRDNPSIKEKDVPAVGGLSGKVVQELADNMIAHLYKKTGKEFVIIGCGGVFTAEDAYKKIKLGASLIQMITGMIYEGPQVISEINQGLVKLLEKDGYQNVQEAVGVLSHNAHNAKR
ncbi:TPA: quinone-dependent dihydroorotate dehydrogenase [Candidatus Woesearchaeota archaeon]|nr:quinone-dependent dihydroorotate dehydrogenase [Candidatus Woesearchaeota archaeon]HIH46861.1 quinone-dependent dihydroorotate dehydrogenase [Candidatus Woesearchaeota archaeon]